jgi:hypothetical protein
VYVRIDRPYPTDFAAASWPPDGRLRMALIIKATFAIEASGRPALEAREQLPILAVDEPYPGVEPSEGLRLESDRVTFKPGADVVVVGHAHTPLGKPRPLVDVRVRVGKLERRIKVIGDRKWFYPPGTRDIPLQVGPVEFSNMPLTYDRAFGGRDEHAQVTAEHPRFVPWCASNFPGRGFIGARTSASIHEKALPNLEDPEQLIRSFDTWPRPVGLGFFPRNSEPRSKYLGTYDDAWRAEPVPNLPKDFDARFWNGAHPDLQVPGYLRGDEQVELENVTPGGGVVRFELPGVAPEVTLRYRAEGVAAAEEGDLLLREGAVIARPVQAVLDTAVFLPDEGRFYLVWRAGFYPREADASEVLGLDVCIRPLLRQGAG